LKSKALRNIEILKDEYENSKSSYYAFHIGQSYNILENTEEAIAFFKLALEDNNLKKEYRSTALRVLAVYKSENNLIDEAQQYINEAIKSDKQQPMNYMVAAQLCEKLGNQNEQLSFIKEALVTNQSYSDSTYKSSQNIFIDDYLIVCSGIKAALLSGIAEDINYFWNELQLVGNKDLELKPAIEVINNLLKGELNELKVDDILRCINNSNLELMVTLFKIHSDISFIEKTFEELHNRDADNLYVLRELALHQFNKGNLEKAELLFEKAISKNVPDPSIYFYLISVILQNNQIEKLPGILTLVVERFGDNPEVISKLNILQQKLQNLQGSVC
jgi:tetratricopeptide (TPR) repeat protein